MQALTGMPLYRITSRQPLALAAQMAAIMASGGNIAPRVSHALPCM